MEIIPSFDEDTIQVLRLIAEAYRGRSLSTPHRLAVSEPEQGNAPEVYVALAPAGGIISRSGDVPGSADCNLYRLLPNASSVGTLTNVSPLFRTVYNLSLQSVPGSSYFLAKRDKWGIWWADSEGTPSCSSIITYETDLRCEAGAGTSSGTGTGTRHHLNLYQRTVILSHDSAGCLTRSAGPWTFQRAVACCDPACATPLPSDCLCSDGDYSTGPLGPAITFTFVETGGSTSLGGQVTHLTWNAPSKSYIGLPVALGTAYESSLVVTCFNGKWYGNLECSNYPAGYDGVCTVAASLVKCSPLCLEFTWSSTTCPYYPPSCAGFPTGSYSLRVTMCPSGTGTGGGGGTCGILDSPLGVSNNAGVNPTCNINGITLATSDLLIVNLGEQGGMVGTGVGVTWNGLPLTFAVGTASGGTISCNQYYLKIPAGGMGNIVATKDGGATNLSINAIKVKGLVNGTLASSSSANGSGGSTPTVSITDEACSYSQAAVMKTPETVGGWAAPFTTGSQDDGSAPYRLTEGFLVDAAGGPVTATYTSTPAGWAMVLGNYH